MTIDTDTLLLLKSSGIGDGEPDLGNKLMAAFLEVLFSSESLPAQVICMNSGVFLTTEGSPVAEVLGKFEENGVEFYSCSTCLEYYDRSDKLILGQPGNMKDTVAAMRKFKKVLAP